MPVDVVLVANVLEVPDLALGDEHGDAEGVDGCVAEALVVEPAAAIEPLEVFLVCLAAEEAEVADLEVGEELAVVVVAAIVRIQQPIEIRIRMHEVRMRVYEGHCAGPEGGE